MPFARTSRPIQTAGDNGRTSKVRSNGRPPTA